MKFKFLILLSLSFVIMACAQNKSDEKTSDELDNSISETTTYYFIRHAEKDRSDPNDRNPHLTEEGIARSENWAQTLKNVDFDAIYSTDYNRTLETAKPLAELKELEINIYDASNLNDENFKIATKGLTVFVVGHSNTTPMFANAVIGEDKYEKMDDSDNSGLYIVKIEDGKVSSELRQIKM